MSDSISDRCLEAFLDEALPADEAASVERRLRDDAELRERLTAIHARRDRGDYSLGAFWQQRRVTCADRSTLGAYVLGVLADDEREFLELHLNVVGCRYCQANLEDLKAREGSEPAASDKRRRRIFDSSAGKLRKS